MKRRRTHRRTVLGAAALVATFAVLACLPGGGPPLIDRPDAEPPGGPVLDEGGVAPKGDVDLGSPFAIDGLVPSHGPFSGGTRASLSGRGFSSKLRVWIGGTELAPSAIFASDPTRAAVETPRGAPGPADVRVRDDASRAERTLKGGFFYDAFVVTPNSGATTGGTRISLEGSGTAWASGILVAVAGKSCTDVAVTDATHLTCATPVGSPRRGRRDRTATRPTASAAASPAARSPGR
jgi:hypothetical protein